MEIVASQFKMNVNELVCNNMTENDHLSFIDSLYNDLFQTWADLHFNAPVNTEQVRGQSLRNNTDIKVSNKLIYYQNWQARYINLMNDIINKEGKILTK